MSICNNDPQFSVGLAKPGALDLDKLSPFQRTLLVTDGTVTAMLESYFAEPMDVIKLQQRLGPAAERLPDLELEPGASVLERRILLRGHVSGRNRVYAESSIVTERLSLRMRDGLLYSREPIGFLMLAERLETFREMLGCGRHSAGALASYFRIAPDDSIIYRVYRVFAGGRPIMRITEKFPEHEMA